MRRSNAATVLLEHTQAKFLVKIIFKVVDSADADLAAGNEYRESTETSFETDGIALFIFNDFKRRFNGEFFAFKRFQSFFVVFLDEIDFAFRERYVSAVALFVDNNGFDSVARFEIVGVVRAVNVDFGLVDEAVFLSADFDKNTVFVGVDDFA